MKRIITYGTFDLTHLGHINLLRRAKSMADYLIVGLSSDEFNRQKGKSSIFSYDHRKEILEAIRYVDLVIPETNWEQKIADILNLRVDMFVIGDDWQGKFDYLREFCEVIYLPRTLDISTSEIKSFIRSN
jgi:glycerol-3-phosphate cytidylyltransferase